MRPFAKFQCDLTRTTVEISSVYSRDVVYDMRQAELIENTENTKEIASGRGNKEG